MEKVMFLCVSLFIKSEGTFPRSCLPLPRNFTPITLVTVESYAYCKHWQEEWLCCGGCITQIKTGRGRKMDLGRQSVSVSDLKKKWNWELKYQAPGMPFPMSTA